MKREILFRGQDEKGNWHYGDLVHDAFDGTSKNITVGIKKPNSYPVEVIPDTVGQFTGLTDKNGLKEFEHAKVKVSWTTASTGRYFQSDDAWCEHEAICVIQYVGNRFVYVREDGRQLSIRNDAVREVIGNIHDNPELL